MELGIGVGFVATALVLWRTVGDIAGDVRQINAYAGQFLLSVLIISLSLPIVVHTVRRGLPEEIAVPQRFRPIEPFRRQMLVVLLGFPILVALGWITVEMSRMPVAELGQPILIAVGLITCLIPLGFGIVTGRIRFFFMTLLVVSSGLLLGQWYVANQEDLLFAFGLFIWGFAGILFLLTGGYQFLLFRREFRLNRTTHEPI